MTREQAEKLADDLIYAARDHEKAQSYETRYTLAELEAEREKVIAALVGVERAAPPLRAREEIDPTAAGAGVMLDAARAKQWNKLPALWLAIVEHTAHEGMFWLGEALLFEITKETGYTWPAIPKQTGERE
jgi:hypothetical protein